MDKLRKWIFLLLFLPALSFPSQGLWAGANPEPSEDQVIQDALKQIKTELIAELEGRGHPKLAQGLGRIPPEKLGIFLGNLAAQRYDDALNLVGTEAADYFLGYFMEKATDYLPRNSPIIKALDYVPINTKEVKEIYHKI